MDYEKRYEKALERAIIAYKDEDKHLKATLERIFPELKEPEDEQLRKEMLQIAKESEDSFYMVLTPNKRETLIALLEKQGEQNHADKIEPKFKVGDWITSKLTGSVYQITNCIENLSDYSITNGNWSGSINNGIINDYFHLWTIKDAKDGDVLYAKGSFFKEYLFMFSSFTEDNVISTHFGYDVCHKTFDTKLTRLGRKEDFMSVTPATKEQRELLFEEMHRAGYKWDAVKEKPIKL